MSQTVGKLLDKKWQNTRFNRKANVIIFMFSFNWYIDEYQEGVEFLIASIADCVVMGQHYDIPNLNWKQDDLMIIY